jgi:hypothetical protein
MALIKHKGLKRDKPARDEASREAYRLNGCPLPTSAISLAYNSPQLAELRGRVNRDSRREDFKKLAVADAAVSR